jgi:hypothetical protein
LVTIGSSVGSSVFISGFCQIQTSLNTPIVDTTNTTLLIGCSHATSISFGLSGASSTLSTFHGNIQTQGGGVDSGPGITMVIGIGNANSILMGRSGFVTTIQSSALILSNNPWFSAYYNIGTTNATGGNQGVVVAFNNLTSPQRGGNNYSTSTGLFTAPYAGVYYFEATVMLTNLTSSNTSGGLNLTYNASTVIYSKAYNVFAVSSGE